MAEMRRRRDSVADADLVEVRLDSVRDPDVAAALADRRRPVLVTCRPVWEGGAFSGSEEERKRILREALIAGADYVDIEARAGLDDLIGITGGRRIVLSVHDFEGVPGDLDDRVRAMRATGAEIVKIAVTATRLADCARLLATGRRSGADPLVLIAMGERGFATRVLPSRFRSMWSYAGPLAGVGQLGPDALVSEFRFREIGEATAIFGIAGFPVAHSVSPAMHNRAFRAAGIDAVYLPLPAIDVDDFVSFARAFEIQGASITTPYKVAMFNRVDEASSLAKRVGALNTLRVDRGRWLGDNSDVSGFLEPLADCLLEDARASLVGAGGAARGVAVALAAKGARVTVHARNQERAYEVAALASGSVGRWPPERGSWDLLVNCTPVGTYPHVDETPVPADCLGRGIVYDLVYNPQMTRLRREAEAAGCRTIGGLEMLVGQARQQFEWWTGVRPQAALMREAAVRTLAEFAPASADRRLVAERTAE
jgi:3-dehydroquinate dehydratase/shikimate dehydrogenase